jgi:hypothetical protein
MSWDDNPPNLAQLRQYKVQTNDTEVIKWSLYDRVVYPQPGTAQLQFFNTPKGQAGKTYADTNMTLAGQLSKYTSFLVTGIEFYLFPNANAFTTQGNAAAGPAAAQDIINDTVTWWQSYAFLQFNIIQKPYLFEAPLMKFPPACGLAGFAALSDSTTIAGAQLSSVQYAANAGRPYEVKPGLWLEDNANFDVSLNWPTLVPISAAATVFCQLNGWLYRRAQ